MTRKHTTDLGLRPLAIVGIGCRLPGGVVDVKTFWDLLIQGRSGIVEVPDERWDRERYYHPDAAAFNRIVSKWGGFVDNATRFDARFWGLSPREVARMDPQQRWLLEVAWEAIEDAGVAPSALVGRRVGVFVGIASHDFGNVLMADDVIADVHTNSGSTSSIASNRISYLLDLKGPSLSVDTACSSALTAAALACGSIWAGESDAALVGGVNAMLIPQVSIGFSRASMLSPSGQCFAFDARANGYVRGEGAGMLLIKRLVDALRDKDRIYAVIRGAAANQDGRTSSMTVPGLSGQSSMLREAYERAGIAPGRVAYLEAHGTGTPVGDPIELQALGEVLGAHRDKDQPCLVGSVKTNIGHLEAGAGIAGLIKAALVLHHQTVPPNLNFETPNPKIPFERLRLKVATKVQPLPRVGTEPAVVGVNSFGFGGANAHVVLESAPAPPEVSAAEAARAERPHLLPVSARDDIALRHYVQAYREILLDDTEPLSELCCSAGSRKEQHGERLVAIGTDRYELRDRLGEWLRQDDGVSGIVRGCHQLRDQAITFVFTGQGAQWWAMGQQLIAREPIFRAIIERIDVLLQPLAGWSLLEEMCHSEADSRIDRTEIAQPAIFALQLGLTHLWEHWGIAPTKVVGHSVGEVAAAHCAGIYSIEDAVKIIFHRSRLQSTTGGAGRMLAAGVSAAEARQLIGARGDQVEVAAVNSRDQVTLAGDTGPLEQVAAELEAQGRFVRWLRINYAFHTHQMEPIRADLVSALADIEPRPARIPFISTVTGNALPGAEMTADYWWRNVRYPVLFAPAIGSLIGDGDRLFLELGPHPALGGSVQSSLAQQGVTGAVYHSLRRNTDESVELLTNAARLHVKGLSLDWLSLSQSQGRLTRLPGYPWNRQTYWFDPNQVRLPWQIPESHPLLGHRIRATAPTWELELDIHRFRYLKDHRFWDRIVFPASAYCEMGLALARLLFPEEPYRVEALEIKKALFVPNDGLLRVRTVVKENEKTFTIYSSGGPAEGWTEHVEGHLSKLAVKPSAPVDLGTIQAELAGLIDREGFYAALSAAGYQFGPSFQQVQRAWRGVKQALVEITAIEAVARERPQYHFHPALLDACFNAAIGLQQRGAERSAGGDLYLPAHIERMQLYADHAPEHLWARATRQLDDGRSLIADLEVFDCSGRHIADVIGFRADRVEQEQPGGNVEDALYQFQWEPCRLRGGPVCEDVGFPSTTTLLDHIKDERTRVYLQHQLAEQYQDFVPELNRIAGQCIENAFHELGWTTPCGEALSLERLMRRLGIASRYHRLTQAYLQTLEQSGRVQHDGIHGWRLVQPLQYREPMAQLEALQLRFPSLTADINLQRATAPRLAAVLRGDLDPLELMFPSGSAALLDAFYAKGADFPALHELIAAAVKRLTASLPPQRTFRVLEAGAGTGSLTRCLLPILPAGRSDYLFTDIGPAFLAAAKERFTDYDFVEYRSFDIEKDPSSQGIPAQGFDLLLLTNVLHATADLQQTLSHLRNCLVPGGMVLFVEVVKPRARLDTTFGLLKGWWRFTDTERRQTSALLDRSQWTALLDECGFCDVGHFTASPQDNEADQAVFFAFRPQDSASSSQTTAATEESVDTAPRCLLFADTTGVADALAQRLQAQGRRVVRVQAGTEYGSATPDQLRINPGSPLDMRRLFSDESLNLDGLTDILHCWSLDHPPGEKLDTEALAESQDSGVLSALQLIQVVAQRGLEFAPRIRFVIRALHCITESDAGSGIASAPLQGFVRVANNEHPELRCTLIDLQPNETSAPSEAEIDALVAEIERNDEELEIAYRAGQRYALRLHHKPADQLPRRVQDAWRTDFSLTPYRLQTEQPGILTNLSLNETQRRAPLADEVELRVLAGGINFRDVMKALGMYPGNPRDLLWLGDDVAGVVERIGDQVTDLAPGDAVVGMAPYGFRAYATVNRRLFFKKPERLSFIEAATLPTVFLTAHYALNRLARIKPGESVLIHAGTGGVGQAAIQIAQRIGAQVFATAGTPEKREMLKRMGVHHVMSSRTLEFVDEIMRITAGRGVDAVLNSLAGEFIPKSFSVLAPFGRFLEIGKVDVYGNTKIGLQPLRNNISYFVIDLAQHLEHRPDEVAEMFAEIADHFQDGDYRPLGHSVFPITEVVEAFRFMAQGKHVGKNVLSFNVQPIPIGPCTEDGHLFRSAASYLITGGTSGFGLEVGKWMASQGARHLVLMSRSGPRDQPDREAIEDLRKQGINVVDARGDVSQIDDVERVLQQVADQLPPLIGVIHGAMVLDDEFLLKLNERRFSEVLAPKVLGAWNLHLATRHLPLEHFICFSSFAAVIGSAKQASYSAANAFLDQLAHYRHAQGLPALTYNWTALSGAGFVARNAKTAEYLDRLGMKSLSMEEAFRVMRSTLLRDPVQIAAGRADWEAFARLSPFIAQSNTFAALRGTRGSDTGGSIGPRILAARVEDRAPLVEAFVAEQVAGVFSIEPAKVDRDAPLSSLGLDSLLAVDLVNRIESEVGASLPMGNILSGANVKTLSQKLLHKLSESVTRDESAETDADNDNARPAGPEPAPAAPEQFPLSQSQQALWERYRDRAALHPRSVAVVGALRLTDHPPSHQLAVAVKSLIDRYPLLNARIVADQQPPLQRYQPDAEPLIHQHPVGHLDTDTLIAQMRSDAEQALNPTQGPAFVVDLYTSDQTIRGLLLRAHPVFADTHSMRLLLQELIGALAPPEQSTVPDARDARLGFHDLVHWEQAQHESDRGQHAVSYWRAELAGAPWPFALAGDHQAGGASGPSSHRMRFALDADLSQRLISLAGTEGASLEALMLSSFALALHQLTGRSDILIATASPGRELPSLEPLVGPLEMLLPWRSRLDADPIFTDLLQHGAQSLAEGRRHLRVDHRAVLRGLGISADTAPAGLLELSAVGFRFEPQYDGGVGSDELTILSPSVTLAITELGLCIVQHGSSITGEFDYRPERFDNASLVALRTQYLALLEAIVAHPVAPISQIRTSTNLLQPQETPTSLQARPTVATAALSSSRAEATRRPVNQACPETDTELPADIAPPEPSRTTPQAADRVLLTGSTGFIGAFLLNELLVKTNVSVICLVRAADEASAMQRVRANLLSYKLQPPDLETRVQARVGDLSKPRLGLTPTAFDTLAADIDLIYHNGANVNLGLPYQALRDGNVLGTQEILRLACRSHLKPVHYVSTFTVMATDQLRGHPVAETDPLPPCEQLFHGYGQTKWVCEILMQRASERGIPVTVYRPGHVSGHSETGIANTEDLLHTILFVCSQLGAMPDQLAALDITPVDYVVAAIVGLSIRAGTLGGRFHLTNPLPLDFRILGDVLEEEGIHLRRLAYPEWRQRLLNLAEQLPTGEFKVLIDTMLPEHDVKNDEAPALHARYDCRDAVSVLEPLGIVCPPADGRLIQAYIKYWRREELLPALNEPGPILEA